MEVVDNQTMSLITSAHSKANDGASITGEQDAPSKLKGNEGSVIGRQAGLDLPHRWSDRKRVHKWYQLKNGAGCQQDATVEGKVSVDAEGADARPRGQKNQSCHSKEGNLVLVATRSQRLCLRKHVRR